MKIKKKADFYRDIIDGLQTDVSNHHPVVSKVANHLVDAFHAQAAGMSNDRYHALIGRLAASLDGIIVTTTTIMPTGD